MENRPLLQTISLTIKTLRLGKGLSQEKFAYKIGIDRKYASIIEKGNVNVSILILKKVCDGLGISLADFFKEVEGS